MTVWTRGTCCRTAPMRASSRDIHAWPWRTSCPDGALRRTGRSATGLIWIWSYGVTRRHRNGWRAATTWPAHSPRAAKNRPRAWRTGWTVSCPKGPRIFVSPARRCEQTAQALGRKYKLREELAPGASADQLLALVQWPLAKGTVLVVGHQPTLGQIIAQLLGLSATECTVKKGAVWWLRNRQREAQSQTVVVRGTVARGHVANPPARHFQMRSGRSSRRLNLCWGARS